MHMPLDLLPIVLSYCEDRILLRVSHFRELTLNQLQKEWLTSLTVEPHNYDPIKDRVAGLAGYKKRRDDYNCLASRLDGIKNFILEM